MQTKEALELASDNPNFPAWLRTACKDAAARLPDAERYRWMRDMCSDWGDAGIVKLYLGPDYSRSDGPMLDMQVDAAIAAAPAVGAV